MSWLKTALTTNQFDRDSVFTIVDPYDFYEWKHLKTIPAGTKFFKYFPPSDIFTTGKVVACTNIPDNMFKKSDHFLELTSDIQDIRNLTIKIGTIPTSVELKAKYNDLKISFNNELEQFKQELKIMKFYTHGDNDFLYKVSYINENESEVQLFDKFEEIMKKANKHRDLLKAKTDIKNGRAHEMAEFIRYSNNLAAVANFKLQGNSEKINYLLTSCGVQGSQKWNLPWLDCYVKFSHSGNQKHSRILELSNKTWLRF